MGGSGGMDAIDDSKCFTISDNAEVTDSGSPGGGQFSESAIVRQRRGRISAFIFLLASKTDSGITFGNSSK